ncbi:MAG: CoA transferase [Desulfobacterales bacterium]|nr:CoA transferase [Desulfobacterales bacterium]
MILADHGADVISIESKHFQSDELYFKTLNRKIR